MHYNPVAKKQKMASLKHTIYNVPLQTIYDLESNAKDEVYFMSCWPVF